MERGTSAPGAREDSQEEHTPFRSLLYGVLRIRGVAPIIREGAELQIASFNREYKSEGTSTKQNFVRAGP